MNSCFRNIFRVILFYFFLFNFSSAIAQCAGTDSEITICNKEADPSLQTLNLFDVLIGETPGGTWIALSNFDSDALEESTGILNLWEINRFGPHAFTYMNPACDTSTATVIINLGGYPGESNQNPGTNNVCQVLKADDDDSVNIIDLFIFIDTINDSIGPDVGGTWTEDASNMATGVLTDEFFNFGNVPIGTYTFTYTIPPVNGCSSRSAIIDVEVRRSPNPGIPQNLNLCETDDMSGLTALNLFSRLDDEDTNGEWTDISDPITGEISSGVDFEINVQNIYNNFGPGSYSFAYEVLPEHPICEEQISIFTVCIEAQLVLEATFDVACNGLVTLTYNNTLLDNGFYDLSYNVTGSELGTHTNTQNINFQNGTTTFNLFPDLILTTSETLTIEITDISSPPSCGTGIPLCTSSLTVPTSNVDLFLEPSISVSSTSGCELDDILVTFIDVIDATFIPIDGSLSVSYAINSINFTDEIVFSNGNATITLPSDRFIQGTNELIFYESNTFVHCGDIIKTSILNLIPPPPNPIFSIVPDNRCDATSLQFGFDSPSGEFITYNPVTFDIYLLGSEPNQFEPRDESVSLTNNTQGDGIDINLTNSNDVSLLPDGDYVFIIRSVQDDNATCRGLSQIEIDNYEAQGINIGLTQNGTEHIFDARLTFRIGEEEPATLIKNTFEVCLLTGPVTLSDLSIFAGPNVDITVTDLAGTSLPDTYEITEDEVFNVIFNSAITGCDLGSDQITVTIVTQASSPVLNTNTFCSLVTNTVGDLDVSGQDIIWYDSEMEGTAYNLSDIIISTKAYWAEITISGGCTSANRTQAEINFVEKASTPTPLVNEFCSSATPTISDLLVETSTAKIQWYTSETGEAYTSTSLPLDSTKEYWVSQTAIEGCESDRIQVTYTVTDVAPNPVPLNNIYCTAGGMVFTIEDLEFTDASISREGEIFYFLDAAGTTSIPLTELLENVSSPIYAQQIIAGTCESAIVEVNFTLLDIASKPTISPITICLDTNPTIQDLITLIQAETSSTIILYENETITTPIDINLELTMYSGDIYAAQTFTEGCESEERTLVNVTLSNPSISNDDFISAHCSIDTPTLQNVYLGSENVLWFDENDNPLFESEILQNGMSYFAQIEEATCKSETLEIVITLVDIIDPLPNSVQADFCGIEEKIIADLLEDEAGNTRFVIPINHTLVWYDSNDVSTRNLLNTDSVLDNGIYYAVYEVNTIINGESVICESNAVAITVDLTVCSTEELIIPDAFSPNGDAINDTFELKNIEFVYPDYDIEIFNRYGRVVFKGNLESGYWDGKSNQPGFLSNNILPTGVYFYVINFNRFDTKPYQGQVYLKR